MILLDYVGNRDLRLPREATSTEWLWRWLLGAERVFSEEAGPATASTSSPGAASTGDGRAAGQ